MVNELSINIWNFQHRTEIFYHLYGTNCLSFQYLWWQPPSLTSVLSPSTLDQFVWYIFFYKVWAVYSCRYTFESIDMHFFSNWKQELLNVYIVAFYRYILLCVFIIFINRSLKNYPFYDDCLQSNYCYTREQTLTFRYPV